MITEEQRSGFDALGVEHADGFFSTLRQAGGMSRRARQERMEEEAYELMTKLGVAREDRSACIELVAAAFMRRHRELEDEAEEDPGVV